MATTWYPHNQSEKPRTWLLTNGETVTEPRLEMTATGLKVRVAGTSISAYTKDMDSLILKSVQEVAQQRGTEVWMPLHNLKDAMQGSAGFVPDETPAELFALSSADNAQTIAWWRFRHPTLPIEALLQVRAGKTRTSYGGVTEQREVVTKLTTPDTIPALTMNAVAMSEQAYNFNTQVYKLNGQEYTTAQEFVRDNPPSAWDPGMLGRQTPNTERQAVEALLKKVRACEELESVEILDLRDPLNPEWMELELYETNVNANFLSDLTEFLEGTPTVQEALRIYEELRDCLRGIGLVLEKKGESDFSKALLSDDPAGMLVDVTRPHVEGNGFDTNHKIRMHLPTGTFVVDCSLTTDLNAVAEKWEEARTIASLSGEEDTLLAYANEVAKRGHKERARKVIRERGRTT